MANEDPLTPQQRRVIASNIERCGQCRGLLDLARSLGRDDPQLREEVDHLEGAGRSALQIADLIKTGLPTQ